jgi:hypothetical protein
MALRLEHIVSADEAPADTQPTDALTALNAPRHRRNFLRTVGYAALAVGATALAAPFVGRPRPAYAESRGGLQGHDGNACSPAYPTGYVEQNDTHGIYTSAGAACFGGSYMGWNWCNSGGWHRSDWARSADNKWCWHMSPRSDLCGSPRKNAWRWTTPDGKVWRCSDGRSVVFRVSDNKCFGPYLSICRARV